MILVTGATGFIGAEILRRASRRGWRVRGLARRPELAEEQARHALRILGDRDDLLDELGGANLALGRALLVQDRLDEAASAFAHAESAFDQLGSASHRAAAWMAQGDLAAKSGDDANASRLYRRAAEILQDLKF